MFLFTSNYFLFGESLISRFRILLAKEVSRWVFSGFYLPLLVSVVHGAFMIAVFRTLPLSGKVGGCYICDALASR